VDVERKLFAERSREVLDDAVPVERPPLWVPILEELEDPPLRGGT